MSKPRLPVEHEPADPVTPLRELLNQGREPSHKRSITSDVDDALELDLAPSDPPEEEIPGEDDMLRAGDPDVDPLRTEYSGEDSPGGTNSSPDANNVDTIGELYGVHSKSS